MSPDQVVGCKTHFRRGNPSIQKQPRSHNHRRRGVVWYRRSIVYRDDAKTSLVNSTINRLRHHATGRREKRRSKHDGGATLSHTTASTVCLFSRVIEMRLEPARRAQSQALADLLRIPTVHDTTRPEEGEKNHARHATCERQTTEARSVSNRCTHESRSRSTWHECCVWYRR